MKYVKGYEFEVVSKQAWTTIVFHRDGKLEFGILLHHLSDIG
jgi:hypothetical protein